MEKIIISSFILAAILSNQVLGDGPRTYGPAEPIYGPANYQFAWRVNDDYSKNNYGQDEKSDSGRTSGSYYVALPDGRLQKVSYTVNGDDGYRADVSYEGEARITNYQQASASSYQPVQVPAPRNYKQSSNAPVISSAPVSSGPVVSSAPISSAPYVSSDSSSFSSDSSSFDSDSSSFGSDSSSFSSEPIAAASSVVNSPAPSGEVYYKPVENAPAPEVYYKPVPEAAASTPEVYYKPLPATE